MTINNSLKKTLAYYAVFVILGMQVAVIGPALPGLAEQTQSTLSAVSILFVMRNLGYISGALIAGRLYDRVKGHPVLTTTILFLSINIAFIPLYSKLWALSTAIFLIGLLQGVIDVGGNTLLVWVHREKVGPYMNGLHFFFGLGAFLAPIIIAQAIQIAGNISWAFWCLAMLIFPCALVVSRLSSPLPILSLKDEKTQPILPLLVVLIALVFFFYVGAEISFGGWIFTYTTITGLADAASAAYLTSGFWGSYTIGRLIAIPLTRRLSSKMMVLCDFSILLSSLALMFLFPRSFLVLWVGVIGVGIGMASIFPTMLSFAGKHMTMTGFVTSWFFVGSSLGGMSIPWLIGQVINVIDPRSIFLIIGGSVIVDVLLFLFVLVYTQKKSKSLIRIQP